MRLLKSSIKIALRALRVNKMRSSLTMLGVVIGVGAVIAMASIGAGAEAQIAAQMDSLGSNIIVIQPGSQNVAGVRGGLGGSQTLTREDADALLELQPVAHVAPQVRSNSQVVFGNRNWFTRVTGTTPGYFQIHDWQLSSGVSFTTQEEAAIAKVAVIGRTVREALFGNRVDPLGQVIRLNKIPFTVVGVLNPKGQSPTGQDQDDTIVIPLSTAMKRVFGRTGLRTSMVSNIEVQATSAETTELAEWQIRDLLRYRHGLTEGQEDDFQARMLTARFEARQEASAAMSLLLAAVAGVSLLVGGIGIMNIMLVSVTERTKEIGLRLAVGAKSRHILVQFLTEAITVSAVGGLAGIALGAVASSVIADIAGWPVRIESQTMLLAFGFSAMVGIFFGYYPARKASFLDPIEAIRQE